MLIVLGAQTWPPEFFKRRELRPPRTPPARSDAARRSRAAPRCPAAVSDLFVALTPPHLLACFIGTVLGTIVGVLPGLGPAGAMALVLPLTIKLGPTAGLIMLAGIYYGAMYGGSTTSILVNVPGEAASVVTTIDGYRLAR